MTTGANAGKKCTQCGCQRLEDGFIEDKSQGSHGYVRWIAGLLELGPMGGAKRIGRQRLAILAFRCPECGHLELFTPNGS